MFSPEFPRPIVILFNWAFGAIAFLAVLQLALDAVTLVTTVARGRMTTAPDEARYAIGAIAGLLAGIGVHQATRVPSLKDLVIRIRDLPQRFEGYTMLQLTDLHISRLFPAKWAGAVVDRSNALGVDLVVVTGDLIDGALRMRRADIEPLRDLRAKDGVLVIPGNHEYFFDYGEWMRHYADMGMRVLANSHVVLDREGDQLVVAGVTDRSAPHAGRPGPDLDSALRDAPANAPVVLLDHQPKDARRGAACGVVLQLSGHTHGGMIRGLDRLVARGNSGFVSGRYDVDGMTLYVNNGTALWPGFALRLGRPSELTRVTLRGQE